MAIYFFHGDEDYNIELKIEDMKSKLDPNFSSMNFQVFDNPDYQKLIAALRTPPMMFGKMLIVINSDKYFLSQKKAFEDNELEDIEDALKHNSEAVDIIFVVKLPRNENKKIDSRKKIYKILNQYNTQEFPVFRTYKTEDIKSWVSSHAKNKKDITLEKEALEFLVEQVGNDLRQFDSELDKLKLIAYPNKTITKKMVEDITISNQDLFNITDLILKNKKDKALLEFQNLVDKKHPLEILAAIQTMLRKLILIKIKHSSCSALELSRLTGMHEFVVKQTITKLKNTMASDLINLKQNLYNVECKIKSAEALDIVSEVEVALVR